MGKRWCSSCHCMPPQRMSENQLEHIASRVERNCASVKSYLRSVSLMKISSDWWVTVTMVAVISPESQTPRKTVLAGSHAVKAAQCVTRRASSFHFLCLSTYRIESKRQYRKSTEKGIGQYTCWNLRSHESFFGSALRRTGASVRHSRLSRPTGSVKATPVRPDPSEGSNG